MADGSATVRNEPWRLTYSEGRDIEKASKRLARAFGYGPSWRSPTIDVFDFDYTNPIGLLNVAHRGRVVESAARSIDGSQRTPRLHWWSVRAGAVTLPYASPDSLGQAALSYARMPEWMLRLLKMFALQEYQHWPVIEQRAVKALTCDIAIRSCAALSAMERILFGEQAKWIDDRAKECGVRAETFRRATRDAEYLLTRWLLIAARTYNQVANAKPSRLGHSDASGIRSSTCWNKTHATPSVVRVYRGRTAESGANDICIRATRSTFDDIDVERCRTQLTATRDLFLEQRT